MLLAIDCGNTHMVLGVYEGEHLLGCWRLASKIDRTEDEYFVQLSQMMDSCGMDWRGIDAMIMGSVVPSVNAVMRRFAEKYLEVEPVFVDHRTDSGLAIRIGNPAEVGADRIINGVAAHILYGGDLIVVDFGTATTCDCITAGGEYIGGAIFPGMEISQRALFSHAARLANVPLERPAHIIGQSTAECLQSGILWGYAGMVDRMIERMCEEWGTTPRIIATGGLAATVAEYSDHIEVVDDELTLEGLRLIYQRVG
ncbi:MAG: type III pantothenate kinase [Firmicutes bacterium]|nr:type III pantothenate kinase [Bacillota bacterium]MBR7113919.1 type III pantothenate kinase [Bacillota bacterium]